MDENKVILDKIKDNYFEFKNVSPELQKDEAFVKQAVITNYVVLKLADTFRGNRAFIEDIIKVQPNALQFASEELKNDPELTGIQKAAFEKKWKSEAEEKVKNNGCKYLVRNRIYVAPMGLSTKEDLKHGAIGIDEWVKLDGGNSYVLKNYKWSLVSSVCFPHLYLLIVPQPPSLYSSSSSFLPSFIHSACVIQ